MHFAVCRATNADESREHFYNGHSGAPSSSGVSRFRRAFRSPGFSSQSCSRFRSAAARSTWDHGDRTRKGRSRRAETDRQYQRPQRQRLPGYATRGQELAKSGKTEEALGEFDRALALDPYNVKALYGRGLIYQGDEATPAGDRGFHRSQWPFAAKGRAAACPCHQLPRARQDQGGDGRSRRGGAGRSRQRTCLVSPRPGLRAARRQGQGVRIL